MKNSEIYNQITETILTEMDNGIVPWRAGWQVGIPCNGVSTREYTGINPFLLAITARKRGFDSPYWLTFNQIRQLDGKVTKGEKSTTVIFFKPIVREEIVDGEKRQVTIPLLRFYNVFNLRQTENLLDPEATPNWHPFEQAESIAKATNATIKLGKPSYNWATDIVKVPAKGKYSDRSEYYNTLFHELSHWTGHKSRLNRFGSDPNETFRQQYGKEELVAEFGACFACGRLGISPNYKNSAAYISGWKAAIKENPNWLVCAASAASRAVAMIFGDDQIAA